MSLAYPNKRWSDEKRERVALLHRRRHGAPDGYSTVHGIHVPSEHEKPLRYWADWLKHNQGAEAATRFLKELKAANWERAPELRAMWLRKKQIGKNREMIRQLVWEAYHANPNRG